MMDEGSGEKEEEKGCIHFLKEVYGRPIQSYYSPN